MVLISEDVRTLFAVASAAAYDWTEMMQEILYAKGQLQKRNGHIFSVFVGRIQICFHQNVQNMVGNIS